MNDCSTRLRPVLVLVLYAVFVVVAAAVAVPGRATADPAPFDPGAAYPVDGLDVASWQHPGNATIDWAATRHAGIELATIKATEGSPADSTEYTNPWFASDLAAAQAAGLAVAPYHFYLGRHPNTGVAQADYFIAAVRAAGYTGKRPGDLPPVFDFEWDWQGGCPPYASVADARGWLDRVALAFGRTPIIYTNAYFITDCLGGTTELGGYPLQIADYDGESPLLPPGWTSWLMWQWTSYNCVTGVPTCNLTRSVFNGDQAALNAMANRA